MGIFKEICITMGRGRVAMPIGREDVERAIKHTKSNNGAARYLGISLVTYRKAAARYTNSDGVTLLDAHKNKSGRGIPKLSARKNGEPMLMDILEGRVTSEFFSLKRIKQRLIEEGYIEHCCNRCGYKETRAMDEKIPLILSFRNRNKKDWRLENLEFLCYNCYFINIGDVFDQHQLNTLEIATTLNAKKITQFDIEPQHEHVIDKQMDLDNHHAGEKHFILDSEKPDDYGDDLISFVKIKTRK